MTPTQLSLLAVFATLLLTGCASSHSSSDQALQGAHAAFQQVKEDGDVLRSAPKDLIRAGESLAKADRLSSYWGSADDVSHYAYLSQQYSAIAGQKSTLNLNQERAVKLELERQRLQLALREAKLASVQQQGKWVESQIAALASEQTDRGLVMTLGDVLFDFVDVQRVAGLGQHQEAAGRHHTPEEQAGLQAVVVLVADHHQDRRG